MYKEMRALQFRTHCCVYRPYRPMVTWVYKNVYFNFCDNTKEVSYNNYKAIQVINLHKSSPPVECVHEIGHFLYDQLPEILQKQLQTKVIQMCYDVKDITSFVVQCLATHVSVELYSTLVDSYRILYCLSPETDWCLVHPLGYGNKHPVHYATAEAWASACVYYILRSREAVPTVMQSFFKLCKECLQWLDNNKVHHRSKKLV